MPALRSRSALALVVTAVAVVAGPLRRESAASARGESAASRSASAATTGSATPREAVQRLLDGLNAAARSQHSTRRLSALCLAVVSPDVREGFESEPSVVQDNRSCGPVLAVLTGYTSDGFRADVASVAGEAVATRQLGRDEALVSVRLRYRSARGRVVLRRDSQVLATRREGRWWVATPAAVNPEVAARPISVRAQRREYAVARRTAARHRRLHREGQLATRPFAAAASCPAAGLSQAADPVGDVQLADGGTLARPQRQGIDLVAVRHSRDNDQLCFELEFAGRPASSGLAELSVRPSDRHVEVLWSSEGAVGQAGEPTMRRAFEVAAGRGERSLTFRVPAWELGSPAAGYRWAVEALTAAAGGEGDYGDSVPDDLSVDGQSDRYVPAG